MEEKNVCVICGKEVTDTTLITAYTALNSKNFTTAKTLFREYVLANADSAEGYFGLACAKLNLRFDSAFGGKYSLVPTYYLDVDIMHDVDFIKALKLATSDLSQEYMSAFAGVTHILGVWKSKIQKESPYDIFISYKESDEEAGIERTQDSIEAQDLYVYLSSLGYRVFYARESLRGKSDLEKEAYTYQAIFKISSSATFS